MNILFTYITPFNPYRGGIGRVTDTLTKEFQKMGHQVFYLIHPSFMSPFGVTDIEDYNFPAPLTYTPSSDLLSSQNINFYLQYLRDNGIDIVINQCGVDDTSLLWLKAEEVGIPVISHIHLAPQDTQLWKIIRSLRDNTFKEQCKRIARIILYPKIARRNMRSKQVAYSKMLPKTTRLCLLSDKFFPEAEAILPNYPMRSKLMAVSNPNSYTDIDPIDLTQKKKQLLFVGLFNVAKQPQRIIRIWSRIYKQFPDWELVIVGKGIPSLENYMRQLAAPLQRVRFEGFQDPTPYYRDASIFCMTSAIEGFGMVLTEAQQHGCVPMAFHSFASVADIIDNGKNGYLIPPFDEKEYARKLASLMANSSLRKAMAEESLSSVQKFVPSEIATQWISQINAILS